MPTDTGSGPLAGFRILELSSVLMVPYATRLLADMGAEVVMVEPPGGINTRSMGPGRHPEISGISLNLLRNKRSVVLDVKSEAGRVAFLRLAATADGLVTNVRHNALARLRLTYDDVRATNPDLVYCHAVGYRPGTERADDPAFDDTMQAACGIVDLQHRTTGQPAYSPMVIADKVAAYAVATAMLAGLAGRARGGQLVEVPMIDVLVDFVLVEHAAGAATSPPSAPAGYERVLNPWRRPFPTTDGYIGVLPYSQAAFDAIFQRGGRHDLVGDDRVRGMNHTRNAPFLYEQVAAVIATDTTDNWLAFCRTAGVAAERVATLDELVEDQPIVRHGEAGPFRAIRPPMRFSTQTDGPPADAPTIGSDTFDVLTSAGIEGAELDALLEAAGVASAHHDR